MSSSTIRVDPTLADLATIFTTMYACINILRAIYSFRASRLNELNNIIKDAVQDIWDNYVKEKKSKGFWNEIYKQTATEMAIIYVKNRINTWGLVRDIRIRRLIKEQVNIRKKKITFDEYV